MNGGSDDVEAKNDGSDDMQNEIPPIGTMKTVKTFFLPFPALNSTAMNKKLKYSNSYLICL